MRGAAMILLNQRVSKRLRRHVIAQDYVIAELAMIPPVLIISHHAPSSHAKDDEYQDSFDRLLADIESLHPPHSGTNIRLIWCCDLNTQVNAHPPDIGPWTNGGEREGESGRAATVSGAIQTLSLKIFPLSLIWDLRGLRGQEQGQTVLLTSSLLRPPSRGRSKLPLLSLHMSLAITDHCTLEHLRPNGTSGRGKD